MRYLYTILIYLATPFIVFRLLWRSKKNRAYRARWKERFGFIPDIPKEKSIWLHAVSLGESLAATPLISALIEQYPQHTIVVTTTTPTGSASVQKQWGQQVYHVYAPYDIPWVIKRFIKLLRPTKVILMETELWPNLLYWLNHFNIPILIANARLSQRSFLQYQRIKWLFKPLLRKIHIIAAQSVHDAKRFIDLGGRENQVRIAGNIKFDRVISAALLEDAKKSRQHWHLRPTLIAASTHEGEEALILQAFAKILSRFPNALLIVVPRHPERFPIVKNLCHAAGYRVAIRSQGELPDSQTPIYLADTTGELLMLYACADVAFVGGSLVPVGGHNLIEPASLSIPVISGPQLHNFSTVSQLLLDNNALLLANSADEIAHHVLHLFNHQEIRHQYGVRAFEVSEQNRGAVAKHLEWISTLVS